MNVVLIQMLVWQRGSALVSINKVNLHQAQLVLGWVTVSGFTFRCRTLISVCDQPPRSTQPGHPPWVGAVSTSQRAGKHTLQLGSKGRYGSWVAGKTV